MRQTILPKIIENQKWGKKGFAVLIDPDKISEISGLNHLINIGIENQIDYFFVGGSFLAKNNLQMVVNTIKENSHIPVVLFPGNHTHLDHHADSLLFLSLISGRNPEYLIGQQVLAAPHLKRSLLEIIPTGYMLVNDQIKSSVAYVSNTMPIPFDKSDVAACTALAGEMLGLKIIYMDAGSGSEKPIPSDLIKEVKKTIKVPLIVGGGIASESIAMDALNAGADIIVVGNGIEKTPELMISISDKVVEYNNALKIH